MFEIKPRKANAIIPKQCIAARGLLGWSQAELARVLGGGQGCISQFERTGHLSARQQDQANRMAELRAVFKRAGVVIIGSDPSGVKLQRIDQ